MAHKIKIFLPYILYNISSIQLLSVNFEYLNIIHNNLTYVVFKKFAIPVKGLKLRFYSPIPCNNCNNNITLILSIKVQSLRIYHD